MADLPSVIEGFLPMFGIGCKTCTNKKKNSNNRVEVINPDRISIDSDMSDTSEEMFEQNECTQPSLSQQGEWSLSMRHNGPEAIFMDMEVICVSPAFQTSLVGRLTHCV